MAGPIEDAGRPFEENRFYASGSHAGADRRMADLRNGGNPFGLTPLSCDRGAVPHSAS